MKKYIIMVAGYDYANGGVNFPYIADKRRLYLLHNNPSWNTDPDVIFIRMDIKAGKIERNTSNGTSRSWAADPVSYTEIRRSTHYRGNNFIQADTQVMSITDCYRFVTEIGRTEPGTVLEFSILGHGWFGGPVLVNSYERAEYSSSGATPFVRDPWDKDGRTKDFLGENLSDADLVNFKAAFAADGYCWVWGCLFTRAYYDTLYKIMQTTAFRSKTMGSHVDSDAFTITVSTSFANSYYYLDPVFFPANTSELTFTRTLADVKNFLKRGLKRCYPGRFAVDTGITCRAAFLGTYSDYERVYPGHSTSHTVMVIPRNTGAYGVDFSRTIDFYKTYLDMQEDPENRGYGIYTNALALQWWNDVG